MQSVALQEVDRLIYFSGVHRLLRICVPRKDWFIFVQCLRAKPFPHICKAPFLMALHKLPLALQEDLASFVSEERAFKLRFATFPSDSFGLLRTPSDALR